MPVGAAGAVLIWHHGWIGVILAFYWDHVDRAGMLPNPTTPPHPRHNRPFPTNQPRPTLKTAGA
ncbi:MAG TPA: hypothetical protein QF813_11065 [Alphaproteobacteria bacterium]|jgi:hypothetical protein|nr:hypothetical protein [Alphaproteobacteria bacterium]